MDFGWRFLQEPITHGRVKCSKELLSSPTNWLNSIGTEDGPVGTASLSVQRNSPLENEQNRSVSLQIEDYLSRLITGLPDYCANLRYCLKSRSPLHA